MIERVRSPSATALVDLGDRADLAGEVAGEFVDVLREPLPGARDALHLGLSAEASFAADLAGDAGDLGGERRQLVDHRVDGRLELEDLAAGVDVDLLRQVAAWPPPSSPGRCCAPGR